MTDLQLVPRLTYCGGELDRAGDRRADPLWIEAALSAPDVRLIPMWRDQCLTAGTSQAPVVLTGARVDAVRQAAVGPVFLGLDGGAAVFAVDLSALAESEALGLAGAERVLDVRALVGLLSPGEAAMAAYARGILHWNRHQGFCGSCGAATVSRNGGHLRVCADAGCGRLLFPRIEPAVIMLVESADTPRRCLLARHRGSAVGGYSTLAGFVEIGESLEDAVRREVAEEAGVPVGSVTYVASQAWPFPAGLMLGFRATATAYTVTVDGQELVEARWFTRAELRAHAAAGGRLGNEDSIDRLLLHSWLEEGD
ncbi:NAD(+) diphosphatase [Catellatospora sichuanensis]|uniref:NAD(+) diphosphatase n=1 Tax=Catellatospora sichuanensis TaxID=1969805 RepID=UPI00118202E7|nr:NAD(+) diphosphatase [Catellatospora sichuanensis]